MPVTKLDIRIMEKDIPAYVLAAIAGVAPSRISEYRNAKKAIPAHHLYALARALECNPVDIQGFADENYLPAR